MSMLAGKVSKQLQLFSLIKSKAKWPKTRSCVRLKSSFATVEEHKYTNQPQMQLRDIPGPSMAENLATIARDRFRHHHIFLEEMFERYGPIFRHSLPGVDIVYVSDPVDIEHVFRSQESNNPYRGDILICDYSEARGLDKGTIGDDETWPVHRKLTASKLLSVGALKPFFNEMLNVADDTIETFQCGRNLDLGDHLAKWGAESMGVVLFGLRIGTNYKSPSERAEVFINAVNGYFDAEAKLALGIPLYKYFKTPTLKRAFNHLDKQMDITRHFVAEARKEATELARNSIVQQLTNVDKASENTVLQICNNAFIGGVHTTSNAALHLFHNLSKNPEVQQKAYDEIEQVLGDSEQPPTYEQLTQMPYLRALIKEGFRCNGGPIGNMRETKTPVTVCGYHIPAGTKIVLSSIASEEMQRLKYSNPETFFPERWLRDTEAKVHSFSLLPFSFGRRLCAGKRLVEMELSLLVLRFLQKYAIVEKTIADEQVKWIFHLMIVPDRPYTFYLKNRN